MWGEGGGVVNATPQPFYPRVRETVAITVEVGRVSRPVKTLASFHYNERRK